MENPTKEGMLERARFKRMFSFATFEKDKMEEDKEAYSYQISSLLKSWKKEHDEKLKDCKIIEQESDCGFADGEGFKRNILMLRFTTWYVEI